jgi:hypothetical protein
MVEIFDCREGLILLPEEDLVARRVFGELKANASFPKSTKQSFEQQKKGRCLLYVSKPSSVIVYQLEICRSFIRCFQIAKGEFRRFPIQSNRGYYSIKFINRS